jgi:hypothetical protein
MLLAPLEIILFLLLLPATVVEVLDQSPHLVLKMVLVVGPVGADLVLRQSMEPEAAEQPVKVTPEEVVHLTESLMTMAAVVVALER